MPRYRLSPAGLDAVQNLDNINAGGSREGKICVKCSVLRPSSEYSPRLRSVDGKKAVCKGCECSAARERAARSRENATPHQRAARRVMSWRKRLVEKYGLDPEQFLRLFNAQGGACAVCGICFSTLAKRPCVDHAHSTGQVRGLLCPQCNVGIGFMRDSPPFLRRAASYLENPPAGSLSDYLIQHEI